MDIINREWSIHIPKAPVPYTFRTECREMKGRSVQNAIGDEFMLWRADTPVFIEAPTGTGKTSFVYNKLIPHALSEGNTVLLVSNRISLNDQQKKDLSIRFPEDAEDPDYQVSAFPEEVQKYFVHHSIAAVTYQGLGRFLELLGLYDRRIKAWCDNLAYVIFDEIHFGYSDALFNGHCRAILEKSTKAFRDVVRVYMTATPWNIIGEVIKNECESIFGLNHFDISKNTFPYVPSDSGKLQFSELWGKRVFVMLYYKMEADYSDYRLRYFGDNLDYPSLPPKHPVLSGVKKKNVRALLSYIYRTASPENKWLVFVDNKKTGQKIKERLTNAKIQAVYFDADTKKPKKTWDDLIVRQRFDSEVLISTQVIENGVNIIGSEIKNIAIFSIERTTFIQELGRKRKAPSEIVNVWAYVPSIERLTGMQKKIGWHLKIANQLRSTRDYGKAVSLLWDYHKSISYRSLYYVNEDGKFCVNPYAEEILRNKYRYIAELLENDNYMEIVVGWLNGVVIEDSFEGTAEQPSKLNDLLLDYVGKTITDSDFTPVRQAIVAEATKRQIKYIRDDRKDSLSAKSLNHLLKMLEIPLELSKSCKQWKITSVK